MEVLLLFEMLTAWPVGKCCKQLMKWIGREGGCALGRWSGSLHASSPTSPSSSSSVCLIMQQRATCRHVTAMTTTRRYVISADDDSAWYDVTVARPDDSFRSLVMRQPFVVRQLSIFERLSMAVTIRIDSGVMPGQEEATVLSKF